MESKISTIQHINEQPLYEKQQMYV